MAGLVLSTLGATQIGMLQLQQVLIYRGSAVSQGPCKRTPLHPLMMLESSAPALHPVWTQ